jgi:REP element-mobilizing transposase RayT
MIVGYHVVFGAYGFWLPNDPRGSWSSFVGCNDLYLTAGHATKTDDPRSLAYKPHDRTKRLATKAALRRQSLRFTGLQARAVGRGFANYFERTSFQVWACAIMPDHVHLVVGRSRMSVEQLVIQLKGAAARQLMAEECHPFAGSPDARGRLPKCFVRGEWSVFLQSHEIDRSIRYVERNPVRQGMARQRWSFVKPRN